MASYPVLLELDAEETLAVHADALALRLGDGGTVFVPRPAVDPRARSAVAADTALIVRVDSPTGEAALADWLTATAGMVTSGSIDGRVGNEHRVFRSAEPGVGAALHSLIENA
jgi:hypothetical protein